MNDLEYIAGNRDRFVGRLQERYGIAKEEAQKQSITGSALKREAETQTGRAGL